MTRHSKLKKSKKKNSQCPKKDFLRPPESLQNYCSLESLAHWKQNIKKMTINTHRYGLTGRPWARSTYTNTRAADGTTLFWKDCRDWYCRICRKEGQRQERESVSGRHLKQETSSSCFLCSTSFKFRTQNLLCILFNCKCIQLGASRSLDNGKQKY